MAASRFRDDGRVLENFLGLVVVRCPRCDRPAAVSPVLPEPPATGRPATAHTPARPLAAAWSDPRRLVCVHCGLTKATQTRTIVLGGPVDPYFRLPVLLSARFRSWTVWAYNAEHLQVLQAVVGAAVRERPRASGRRHSGTASLPERAARPMSMVEKLPDWMTAAAHRTPVQRVLDELAVRAQALGNVVPVH